MVIFFMLFLSGDLLKSFVVIFGVVDQAVVAEYDALRAATVGAQSVDITFGVLSAVGFGEKAFIVAETIAADAFPRGVRLQRTAFPAETARFSVQLRHYTKNLEAHAAHQKFS